MTTSVQDTLNAVNLWYAGGVAPLATLAKTLAAIPPALPVSPDGSALTEIGPFLSDGQNTIALVAGNRGNDNPAQQISWNGVTDPLTGAVTQVVFSGGKFYQENSAGGWWSGSPGHWVPAPGDPRSPPIVSPPIVSPSPTPPPQAASFKLAFFDDFTDPSTISTGDTIGSGQKWCRPSKSPTGPLNGGTVTVANSIVTIANGGWLQSINLDGTGGFTLSGGGYIEAYVALSVKNSGDSAPLWMMSAEHLQQWAGKGTDQWPGAPQFFAHFGEFDICEQAEGFSVSVYDGAIQDWFGAWNPSTGFPKASNNPGFSSVPTNFSDYLVNFPGGTDPTKFHKYGMLWVPSVGGNQGFAQMFFDDQPTGVKVTWIGPVPNYSGTNPGVAPWTFGIFDNHHFPIYSGADKNDSYQVDWFRVWKS